MAASQTEAFFGGPFLGPGLLFRRRFFGGLFGPFGGFGFGGLPVPVPVPVPIGKRAAEDVGKLNFK
jgi:hypothetical protein